MTDLLLKIKYKSAQKILTLALLTGMFFANQTAIAQVDYVIIDNILIKGLSRTKPNVIYKEINLISGDTISLDQLSGRLSSNEKRLQSMGLFTVVKINLKNWNTDLSITDIEITVQENFFIFPYPVLSLADRNFNVWRKEQNYALDRVNFGLAVHHINLTGNKDKLKIKFQRGYTRKYELAYEYPYINGRWGLSSTMLYAESREIGYRSSNNKIEFYHSPNDETRVFHQYRFNLYFHHRTSPFVFQTLKIEYVDARVDPTVSERLNPQFFGNSKNHLGYFTFDYLLRYDKTLYPLYPVGGHRLELNVRKEGFGFSNEVNNTSFYVSAEKYTPIFKNLILSNAVKIKVNLQPNPLPYFFNNAIGYKADVITGYQLYVLDGRGFLLSNNSLKWRLTDRTVFTRNWVPDQYKLMNLKVFLRFNFDFGFAKDPAFGYLNPLSNKLAYGYGPGLDILLFNIVTFSCEYGITRFNESGFFFKSSVNI
jgi:hypothetical protein